jgi:hypothetical protein
MGVGGGIIPIPVDTPHASVSRVPSCEQRPITTRTDDIARRLVHSVFPEEGTS